MIKLKLSIDFVNGEHVDVVAGPATQVAFEREWKVPISDLMTTERDGTDENGDPNVTAVHFMTSHIYWMAWHAVKSGLGFEAWLETVDEISFDVATPDPTKPATPDAS